MEFRSALAMMSQCASVAFSSSSRLSRIMLLSRVTDLTIEGVFVGVIDSLDRVGAGNSVVRSEGNKLALTLK